MKKFILFVAIAASSFTTQSQALSYEDLGLLFSQSDLNGSARFTAMSGAFGALGGDVSAITINPAGLSVFNRSNVTLGFNTRTTDYTTNYYGNSFTTQEEYFQLSNAGAVLVIDDYNNSDWSKFAIGVNYRILKDFENTFYAEGNSGFASFNTFPLDNSPNNPTLYDIAEEQQFSNFYDGDISELNFGFSALFQEKLHLGAVVNTYSLTFSQQAVLREFNNDGSGNTLDAKFYQENFTSGAGFSVGAGFIYKANDQFRFGVSYQTPTWYTEIIEDTNIIENDGYYGDTEIIVSNNNTIYDNTAGGFLPVQSLLYKLQTPSKLTASAALVFGKFGLISFDYSTRNYQNIELSGANFINENNFFETQLRRTNAYNVGTEWRFNRLSLRGGYRYEQSPDANAIDSDNLESYSLGLGYNFGNVKVDFAYSNNNRTSIYNFYPQYQQVDPANITIDNSNFTASVSISL